MGFFIVAEGARQITHSSLGLCDLLQDPKNLLIEMLMYDP